MVLFENEASTDQIRSQFDLHLINTCMSPFLLQLIGGAMIGIGAWAFEEKNRFQQVAVETVFDIIFDISIVFIAIGIITFVLGFAGCVGALRENCCLLKFVSIINVFTDTFVLYCN